MVTVLAVLRYEKKTGEYPQGLDKLVEEGYLKDVPIDPFSDGPLVYRKTEDGFLLYSVGMNFIDDRGRQGKSRYGKARLWADNGDCVFWPVE